MQHRTRLPPLNSFLPSRQHEVPILLPISVREFTAGHSLGKAMLAVILRALKGWTQTLLISRVIELHDLGKELGWRLPCSGRKEFAKENNNVDEVTLNVVCIRKLVLSKLTVSKMSHSKKPVRLNVLCNNLYLLSPITKVGVPASLTFGD